MAGSGDQGLPQPAGHSYAFFLVSTLFPDDAGLPLSFTCSAFYNDEDFIRSQAGCVNSTTALIRCCVGRRETPRGVERLRTIIRCTPGSHLNAVFRKLTALHICLISEKFAFASALMGVDGIDKKSCLPYTRHSILSAALHCWDRQRNQAAADFAMAVARLCDASGQPIAGPLNDAAALTVAEKGLFRLRHLAVATTLKSDHLRVLEQLERDGPSVEDENEAYHHLLRRMQQAAVHDESDESSDDGSEVSTDEENDEEEEEEDEEQMEEDEENEDEDDDENDEVERVFLEQPSMPFAYATNLAWACATYPPLVQYWIDSGAIHPWFFTSFFPIFVDDAHGENERQPDPVTSLTVFGDLCLAAVHLMGGTTCANMDASLALLCAHGKPSLSLANGAGVTHFALACRAGLPSVLEYWVNQARAGDSISTELEAVLRSPIWAAANRNSAMMPYSIASLRCAEAAGHSEATMALSAARRCVDLIASAPMYDSSLDFSARESSWKWACVNGLTDHLSAWLSKASIPNDEPLQWGIMCVGSELRGIGLYLQLDSDAPLVAAVHSCLALLGSKGFLSPSDNDYEDEDGNLSPGSFLAAIGCGSFETIQAWATTGQLTMASRNVADKAGPACEFLYRQALAKDDESQPLPSLRMKAVVDALVGLPGFDWSTSRSFLVSIAEMGYEPMVRHALQSPSVTAEWLLTGFQCRSTDEPASLFVALSYYYTSFDRHQHLVNRQTYANIRAVVVAVGLSGKVSPRDPSDPMHNNLRLAAQAELPEVLQHWLLHDGDDFSAAINDPSPPWDLSFPLVVKAAIGVLAREFPGLVPEPIRKSGSLLHARECLRLLAHHPNVDLWQLDGESRPAFVSVVAAGELNAVRPLLQPNGGAHPAAAVGGASGQSGPTGNSVLASLCATYGTLFDASHALDQAYACRKRLRQSIISLACTPSTHPGTVSRRNVTDLHSVLHVGLFEVLNYWLQNCPAEVALALQVESQGIISTHGLDGGVPPFRLLFEHVSDTFTPAGLRYGHIECMGALMCADLPGLDVLASGVPPINFPVNVRSVLDAADPLRSGKVMLACGELPEDVLAKMRALGKQGKTAREVSQFLRQAFLDAMDKFRLRFNAKSEEAYQTLLMVDNE